MSDRKYLSTKQLKKDHRYWCRKQNEATMNRAAIENELQLRAEASDGTLRASDLSQDCLT